MNVGGSVKDSELKRRIIKGFNEIDKAINVVQKDIEVNKEKTVKININQNFELRGLMCEKIDNLKQFKDLKASIEMYFEDCKRPEPKMHPGKSMEWKKNLYTLLHNLLNQCAYTSNNELRVEHLKRVYEWYYKKIGQVFPDCEEIGKKSEKVDASQDSNGKTKGLADINTRFMTFDTEYGFDTPSKNDDKAFNLAIKARLDSVFKEFRLRDLSEKQKMDSMHLKIKNWLKAQPKKQEEFLRSQESAKYGSNYKKREYSPIQHKKKLPSDLNLKTTDLKIHSQSFNTKIKTSNKNQSHFSKIAFIRNKYKKIINDDSYNDKPYSALDHNSESFTIGSYSKSVKNHRKDFSTASLHGPRIGRNKRPTEVSQLINSEKCRKIGEIEIIKEKFAKRNILCGVETLKYGLMLTDDLPEEILTYKSLPNPGSGLLSSKSVESKTPKVVKLFKQHFFYT